MSDIKFTALMAGIQARRVAKPKAHAQVTVPAIRNRGAKRTIRIEGDVAYVPLTKGYEAMVDVQDVPLVSGRNWHVLEGESTRYARVTVRLDQSEISLRMHRVILSAPPDLVVDHVNGNGLDNRRTNLRLVTQAKNAGNQVRNRRGHARYVRRRQDGLYECFLYLGCFDDKAAAENVASSAIAVLGL